MKLNTIPEILEDIKRGLMVIVMDDEDRENEGDLIMAGSLTKPSDINFMAKYGRGLICVPMEGVKLDEMDLHPMAATGRDPYRTGWAISCDAKRGITTGISASDRARTINILADPKSRSSDLVKPGHIFPLRANEGGVLVRAGTHRGVRRPHKAGRRAACRGHLRNHERRWFDGKAARPDGFFQEV